MLAQVSSLTAIKTMAEHFQSQVFSFDLNLCEGDCRQIQSFVNEFSDAARLLRSQIRLWLSKVIIYLHKMVNYISY